MMAMPEPSRTNAEQPPTPVARTSNWAVASLLCSLACCPVATLLGPLLGLRALVQIRANPTTVRGRGIAIAGIVIGLAISLVWIAAAIWWQFNARLPMLNGPRDALQAGLAGDVARFKAAFVGDDPAGPADEAIAFLNQLSTRYGRLLDSTLSQSPITKPTLSGPAELRITYTLTFDQSQVEAEAAFVTFAPSAAIPKPVFKWAWIRVIDPLRGDLVYPVAATAQATSLPQSATQPSNAP